MDRVPRNFVTASLLIALASLPFRFSTTTTSNDDDDEIGKLPLRLSFQVTFPVRKRA